MDDTTHTTAHERPRTAANTAATGLIVKIHRWLGLGAALFWMVQAVSGVAIVFRWEIDDATVAGARVPVDTDALAARIENLDRQGTVSSIWASSGQADRFNIYYDDASRAEHSVLVDGAGRILRERSEEAAFANGAIFDTLTTIHQSLFAGSAGEWLVGISGLLLLTNLILALRIAWPRAQYWARTLFMRPRGPMRIQVRGWHRVIGLWGALPALLLVSAGVMLVFIDGLRNLSGADVVLPTAAPAATSISPAEAFSIALARYPGATLSALAMPTEERPWYLVRVRVADEVSRNWGTTSVFISAADGRVLDDQPAASLATARGALDTVYPFHTGQIGGWAGRMLVALLGAWLIAMICLGVVSWQRRRSSTLSV